MLNQIAKQLQLLPANQRKILCDSKTLPLSSFQNSSSCFYFSNYHEDNEGLINRQINLELYASYVYTALSHHFDRFDVALKGKKHWREFKWNQYLFFSGHQKYFKEMAEEENEHANKFMEYQNKRGGTIVLLDIKVCPFVWHSILIITISPF